MTDEQELYRRAVAAWGQTAQEGMLIEEIGEVMEQMGKVLKAWNKRSRNRNGVTVDNFYEELVDLQIMVEQMQVIAEDAGWDWHRERNKKLYRLRKLLGMA